MSFPRYERYKDSGIEWLGKVPEHWEVSALKHQIRMRYGDALASEVREDGDIEVFGSNGPVGLHCVANTKSPAIVVGRKGSYGKIVWTERGGFVIDTAYAIDSDTTGLNLRWVYYGLQPLGLDSLSQDTGVPGLAREKAYEMQIAIPPHFEQLAIAAFLDRETAKIDALIAEQQRLIELLKEKRQAVISHAVTKGLNPDAPMKDSGIEWLGEVPEHWEIKPMRMIANIVRGASPRPAGDPRYFGGYAMPWVTVAEITKDDEVYLTETENFLTDEGAAHSNLFPSGTLIYSNSGATLGVPKILCIDACANDGVVAFLQLNSQVQPVFLYHYLSSITDSIREKIRQGSGQPNLNTDIVKELRFGVPPLKEQHQVVMWITELTEQFGALIAEAQTAITLLQERRTALISAAVTGKIDVRGLVETQPEREAAA